MNKMVAVADVTMQDHDEHTLMLIDTIQEAKDRIHGHERLAMIVDAVATLTRLHAAQRSFHRQQEETYRELEKYLSR